MAYHVEGVPRHEAPNPFKYDDDALAQKAHWLRELAHMLLDDVLCARRVSLWDRGSAPIGYYHEPGSGT